MARCDTCMAAGLPPCLGKGWGPEILPANNFDAPGWQTITAAAACMHGGWQAVTSEALLYACIVHVSVLTRCSTVVLSCCEARIILSHLGSQPTPSMPRCRLGQWLMAGRVGSASQSSRCSGYFGYTECDQTDTLRHFTFTQVMGTPLLTLVPAGRLPSRQHNQHTAMAKHSRLYLKGTAASLVHQDYMQVLSKTNTHTLHTQQH